MDRSLYVSMSGASEVFTAQAIKANNLANLSTPGFKAALVQQTSVDVIGEGLPTRSYAQSEVPGYDLTPGTAQITNNDLDIAIKGEGWIVVSNENGAPGLTRRGDLSIDAQGQLVNGAGFRVEGSGGPIIIPPAQSVAIAEDGQISVIPIGADATTKVIVNKIKLTSVDAADELKIRTDGLFDLGSESNFEDDISISLQVGALETSNVNAVNELVDLISLTRKYELDVKMMNVAKENDEGLARILQL
ncbi:MAG: flagellar basal body rod protein FlgF [Francisellaceae bacterium]|jgi:flagellar basal-body rod protein FlgF|nr:flagellar basal body rod protein FlgF [Francisellaceae bacterium]MBT6206859.1 flagellar basal body rod protein FlgF [Francisellaceae bacterium]MBT6539559.1 flagellar basal body rod protein FlgF [Francisellaceae bacterium]